MATRGDGDALSEALETIEELRRELAALKTSKEPDSLSLKMPGGSSRSSEPSTPKNPPSDMFEAYALGLGLGAQSTPINVCIPMSGIKDGPFGAAGYRFPKPLINVVGRPILHWVLEALMLSPADTVWLAISDELESTHGVLRNVQHAFPHMKVHLVRLTVETCGWVETLAAMTRAMPLELRQRRTLCIDCHTIALGFDLLGSFRKLPEGVGASYFCSIAEDDEPQADVRSDSVAPTKALARGRFSYIKVGSDGLVTDMREKVAISSNVNIGAYGFPSAARLLEAAERYIDDALGRVRQAPAETTPNFHASGLIKTMLAEGKTAFHAVRIDESAFATVGTPDELVEFIARVSSVPVRDDHAHRTRKQRSHPDSHVDTLLSTRRLRFCFDLDSTLLVADAVTGDLHPAPDNIALVVTLHDAGHYIILQTSASMDAAAGNLGRALAASGLRVMEALKKHGIPYDEVHFGKPAADFYIDTVTLNAGAGTLPNDIGWHTADEMRTIEGGIRARSFNQIALVGDKHIIKSSSRKVLAGEAYYYAHIPAPLSAYFPTLVEIVDRPEVDTMSIIQTRVVGVTFSHMLVNLTLTVGRLRLLLDAVRALHDYEPPAEGREDRVNMDEMCANYARKVAQRFRKHRALYDTFSPAGMRPEAAAKRILDFLQGYEAAGRCKHAWHIHGDPVFSNAILTRDGGVKLIDMRGALAERLTTQGDRHYDLSKIYQSLCGYDFMLLDKHITEGTAHYLAQLREVFWSHVRTSYPETAERDIRLLTAAHFFSIVPLHEERDHQERYLRASESMLVVEGLL